MAHEFYYIVQKEDGTVIVEYESNAPPPDKGKILNLTYVTRDQGYVEILEVEQVPEEEHMVVRVIVGPVRWQPEW